jgi:hypothetical protein
MQDIPKCGKLINGIRAEKTTDHAESSRSWSCRSKAVPASDGAFARSELVCDEDRSARCELDEQRDKK